MALDGFRKPLSILAGMFFLIVISALDYLTGREISVSLFYLIPITLFTFAVNNNFGIGMAFLCALIWLVIEVISGTTYSNNLFHIWNAVIRLGFFLLPVLLLRFLEHERTLARVDSLTGAYTNRFFMEALQREIDRSSRYNHFFTVAFIDADDFKVINDTFGHAFGDAVLRAIAEIMKRSLRKTDLVARVGGDEFAILLPETNGPAARSAVSNMAGKMAAELDRMKYPITFSIGALTLSAPRLSADEVLRIADKMMYIVKNGGKNSVRYEIYSEEKESAD